MLAAALVVLAGAQAGASAAAAPCVRALFVATSGDPSTGNGTATNPYRTITTALARARQIRKDGCAQPLQINVGPGGYVGSNVPGDATVDHLPLIVDVPDLTLRGSTMLATDGRGLPTGTLASTSTVSVAPSVDLPSLSAILLVVPGGDRVSVSGFVLDGSPDPLQAASAGPVAVGFDRVQQFVASANVVRNAVIGVSTRAASGLVEGNLIARSFLGAGVSGGNRASPANVSLTRNRVVQNDEAGVALVGTGDTLYPFTPRVESTVTDIFDTINATATDNDLSDNTGDGLWIGNQSRQTIATSSTVTATITDNAMNNNDFGIAVHANLPLRAAPVTYTGTTRATLRDNTITHSRRAPALITFTSKRAAVDPTMLSILKYLRDSTFAITDTGELNSASIDRSTCALTDTGELNGAWIDHSVTDPPLDALPFAPNSTPLALHNTLKVNNAVFAPPIRSAGLNMLPTVC